jgi:hypothetical protein
MALFGKLVKYVVKKGMKLAPNFIGKTSAQAQADVVSEGFVLGNVTTTVSGEPAELANDGKVVEQIPAVTTPTDYEAPVDLTVRQFSFTPFGVFGFSPFNVFGFSPFNVFGFSPFNVFGFSPFRVFGFSPTTYGTPTPYCIDESTPVLTKEGYKLAKDIVVNDILMTKTFDGLPITNHEGLKSWSGDVVTEYGTVESKVTKIKKTNVSETIIINDDKYKRFSTQEDILIIREEKLMFCVASELKINDQIVKSPTEMIGDQISCIVYKIETVKEDRNVYDFIREPFGLIVADSLLVYNAYPVD